MAGDVGIVVTANGGMGVEATATVTVVGHEPEPAAFTPQSSLQVFGTNPAPPFGGDWATGIVKDDRSPAADLATIASAVIKWERGDRVPSLLEGVDPGDDPGEDYDEDAVVLSGWMLEPELSGNDVPFTHPFGNDWECMVALDSAYAGLLAAGNALPDGSDGADAMAAAQGLNIPVPAGGLLAIETDGNCVPTTLSPIEGNIVVGDRIAALGRWIVDTGHEVEVDSGSSYRAEMHPPMLMAIGGNRTDPINGALTRVLLTSRPYLVEQVFTTDTSSIYDDNGSRATARSSRTSTMRSKSSPASSRPRPRSKPTPRSPRNPSRVTTSSTFGRGPGGPAQGRGSGAARADPGQLSVHLSQWRGSRSSRGTRRRRRHRCAEQHRLYRTAAPHAPDADGHKRPARTGRQLVALEQNTSLIQVDIIDAVLEEHALAHGIDTDTYEVPDVNVLDRSDAVPFVAISNIPGGGAGIVVNDGQPYPLYGFVEVRSVVPVVHPIAADTHTHSGATHN